MPPRPACPPQTMFSPHNRASLGVTFQTQVVASNGDIIRTSPPRKNLLLDAGLDFPAVHAIANCFRYLSLGTGNTPTRRSGGVVTFSQSGTAITASSAFFEAADVGRLLKYGDGATGAEVYIAAVTSPTSAVAATPAEQASAVGSIWYVNETRHGAEFLRTGNIVSVAGGTGSAYYAGTWTHFRTFETGAFTEAKLVTEVGWSPESATGKTLFGRALVPNGGDYVAAGNKYRVKVTLTVAYSPVSEILTHPDVGAGGFSTAGTYALEFLCPCKVAGDGNTTAPANGWADSGLLLVTEGCLSRIAVKLSTSDLPLRATVGETKDWVSEFTGGTVVTANAPLDTYISGSRKRTCGQALFDTAAANMAIRSIAFHGSVRVLLSAAQTKTNLYRLYIGGPTFSWGRKLIN